MNSEKQTRSDADRTGFLTPEHNNSWRALTFGFTVDDIERSRRKAERAARARRRRMAVPLEREAMAPASFGLSADELRAEAQRLNWQAWETRARFVDPRQVAA